jgi:outer membrane protein assembly factor BamB
LYDINFELLRQIPTDYPVIMKDDLLITRERHIGVYDFKTNKQLWQVDLSEKTKRIDAFKGTEVEGIIKGVLVYKDNLIVYSDGGIASLKIEDGSLNWFTKTDAVTFCIVGNIGYGGSNAAIYKINLNTGEMSGFDWKNHGMPDIEYQGKIYIPFCGDIIYHEGLLWRSWYDAGHSFLVAINPYDGHYEWIHHVDTNEKIGSPKFHDNKMFLLDTGGTLHIYEKDENNV